MSKPSSLNVVKRPYIGAVDWSETELIELMGCVEDPLYFMSNFMKIQHPMQGAVRFNPYPFQIRIIDAFNTNRFNILMAARQSGKCSTSETIVVKDNDFVKIGSLIRLGFRDWIVDILEKLLIRIL